MYGVAGAAFWARVPNLERIDMAQRWGAPYFAIRHLCPDVWTSGQPVRVVIGDRAFHLTELGGRFLTLLGRAFRAPPQLSISIWSEKTMPSVRNAPRELLLIPPTKIVRKPWQQALKPGLEPPEILLLVSPPELDHLMPFVGRLLDTPSAVRTIIGAFSSLHALLLRALLVECGYTVGEMHEYTSSTSAARGCMSRVWFQVNLEPGHLRALGSVNTADWKAACVAIEDEGITTWLGDAEHSRWYGKISTLVGTAQNYVCLFTGPNDGICLDTGQYFVVNTSTLPGSAPLVFEDEYPVTGELLEEARAIAGLMEPRAGMDVAEVRRYRALCWLADVRTYAAAEAFDLEQRVDEDLAQATPLRVTATVVAESRSEPEPPGVAPVVRPVRSARLSRAAGTVEVLALAAILGGAGERVTLEQASSIVAAWLARKGFSGLSGTVSDQVSTPEGEVTVETDGSTVWAVRFDDRRQMEEGAIWRVEMTLLALPDTCALGVRLSQLRSKASAPDPTSGVPGAVVALGRGLGLWDSGAKLKPAAMRIETDDQFEWLKTQLFQPDRSLAMVVVSTRSGDADASIDRLASRLLGLAHVVVIGPAMARRLSDSLPDRYAVYGNAIRVYRPRPGEEDHHFDHPLWAAFSGVTLTPALADQVAEAVSAISLEHESLEERAPSFRVVRQQLSESRLRALHKRTQTLASTADEERARHRAIVDELEKNCADQSRQSDELRNEVLALREEVAALRRERDDALDEVRVLRHQASLAWTSHISPEREEDGLGEPEIPATWDGLDSWVARHCAGRLVLLPSAAKACRESPFQDIPLAYRSLLLLANEYVDMRRRGPDEDIRKEAFERARRALGLDCSGVGSAKDSHQFKAGYHKIFEEREIQLDMHLKRGNGYDERTMFRVYFHYCQDTGRVIVGHMPSHLTNRKTRNA